MDKKLFDKFMEEIYKNKPAKIIAETDDKGKFTINFEGRGIELLVMTLEISRKYIESSHIPVDDYCKMLKMGIAMYQDKSKEQKDVENAIINKMIKDVFN
jgi:hypothetical protein